MGHWFEILIILALALLVFGPKRMIEMGSQLGKAFRELRNAAKEMDWSSLTGQNETSSTTPSPWTSRAVSCARSRMGCATRPI